MSKIRTSNVIANVYTKSLREAATDTGLARKVVVLAADETGALVKKETMLPGPRVKICLLSTRKFEIQHHNDPRLAGTILIQGNQNNKALADKWLTLIPVWRKLGEHEVLGAILDERGSRVDFEILDDNFETPAAEPAE